MNSDFASQILEASDMLSGNIFLHGWNLTGVTFYLSELPIYLLSVFLGGISTKSFIIAFSLQYTLLLLASFLIISDRIENIKVYQILLFFSLVGFPSLSYLQTAPGHFSIYIYIFLALFCLNRIWSQYSKNEIYKKWFIPLSVIVIIGSMSDMNIAILFVLPGLLICFGNLLRNQNRLFPALNRIIIADLIIGTIVGLMLDKLLIWIGKFNKNSFFGGQTFISVEKLPQKTAYVLKVLLETFQGDFSEEKLLSFTTPRRFFGIIILTAFLILIVKTIVDWIKDPQTDLISVMISFASTLIIMAGLCGNFFHSTNSDAYRYIAFLPFAAAVLFCRYLYRSNFSDKKVADNKYSVSFIFSFICLICIIFSFNPVRFGRTPSTQDEIADILIKNNLDYGYADFWDANSVTVTSKDQVHLRAIRVFTPQDQKPYIAAQNWFCKTKWYYNIYANYIVIPNSEYLNITPENITGQLGQPEKIIAGSSFNIYIYNRNIASDINISPDFVDYSQFEHNFQ